MKFVATNMLGIISLALVLSFNLVKAADSQETESNKVQVIEQHIIAGEYDLASTKLEDESIGVFHQHYLQGWLLVKQQKYDQAKAIWLPLWELHKDKLELGNNLAAVLIQLGDYDLAKRVLETSLQQDPYIASALGNLNNLYSFLAQQAYASIFRRVEASPPSISWLHLTPQTLAYVPPQVIEKEGVDIAPEIMRALVAWRQAWSNQQVNNYLKAYSDRFIPANSQSLQDWRRARERNVSRPSFIDIQLEDIRIIPISESLVRVEFLQNYQSNIITSRSNKVLIFEHTSEAWLIIQEIVVDEN